MPSTQAASNGNFRRPRRFAEGAYYIHIHKQGSGYLVIPRAMVSVIPMDVAFIPEFTDEGILFRAVRPQPKLVKKLDAPGWATVLNKGVASAK